MKNTNAVHTEIHYAQVGEYQLPLLTLPQTNDSEPLGKYGRMRLAYLKNQRPVLYNRMLLNGTLCPHFQEVQRAAQKSCDRSLSGAGGGGSGEGNRVCRVISTVFHVSVSASKTPRRDFMS